MFARIVKPIPYWGLQTELQCGWILCELIGEGVHLSAMCKNMPIVHRSLRLSLHTLLWGFRGLESIIRAPDSYREMHGSLPQRIRSYNLQGIGEHLLPLRSILSDLSPGRRLFCLHQMPKRTRISHLYVRRPGGELPGPNH